MEYLATVSLELELANGSVCKACFSKLEKAMTYLATSESITNKLQEKFALPPICIADICTASRAQSELEDFNCGYMEGCGAAKRWIVSVEDIDTMYESFFEGQDIRGLHDSYETPPKIQDTLTCR